jgi:RNA-binding protein PNO1
MDVDIIEPQHIAAVAAAAEMDEEFTMDQDMERPDFDALTANEINGGKSDMRSITVPPHRYTPLKNSWLKIYTPLVQHLKLQVRMNLHKRAVEIKVRR